ncbi:hypothetical protein [Dietzia alimentaria]|uniref:hypothetical protein n=1 Tax=Dietzia alimentaria TaxID=665550 RepID=UPI00029AA9AA|nr:hypothetical protein [Dietzia alimentaria]
MTTTLLKHEWLRTRGALGMFFGITMLVGILGSLLGAAGWSALSILGLLLGFLAVAVLVPGAQLLLAADYWRSSYGRTGYFTQSIPVRGSTIFQAKLIWTTLVSLVAVVLTGLAGWLLWWAASFTAEIPRPTFVAIGDALTYVGDVTPAWMIVVGAILLLVSLVMAVVYYYFAVSIGHESKLASLGWGGPIIVYVVVYFCTQVLSLVGMIVLPFGIGVKGDQLGLVHFNVLAEMSAGANANNEVMPVGFIAVLLVVGVFCLWRTARSWDRKVALR